MKTILTAAVLSCLVLPTFADNCEIPIGTYANNWTNLVSHNINIALNSLEAKLHIDENRAISMKLIVTPNKGREEHYDISTYTNSYRTGHFAQVECTGDEVTINFEPVQETATPRWYDGVKTLESNFVFTYNSAMQQLIASEKSCYLYRHDSVWKSYFSINPPYETHFYQCILYRK
ncbi:hypothetical protein ACH42_09595 [Endozoicomonas sp. (ex Bugula neritina AB1)]|nr:hypothetical protein ACH42_09595 [Endozoicomonas sp. (ex Bugula neritina AB1)]